MRSFDAHAYPGCGFGQGAQSGRLGARGGRVRHGAAVVRASPPSISVLLLPPASSFCPGLLIGLASVRDVASMLFAFPMYRQFKDWPWKTPAEIFDKGPLLHCSDFVDVDRFPFLTRLLLALPLRERSLRVPRALRGRAAQRQHQGVESQQAQRECPVVCCSRAPNTRSLLSLTPIVSLVCGRADQQDEAVPGPQRGHRLLADPD